MLILKILSILAAAMPEPISADIAWVATGEFCEPETVLPLPDGTLLISNVCDFRVQGNGFLTLMNSDGRVIDWRIVDELDAPLGMAVRDHVVYVVDTNRVRTFSWPGFEPGETVELSTAVANDIAVGPDGTMYITDTAMDEVRVVTPGQTVSHLIGEGLFDGANGIELRGSELYVGGKQLWKVDLQTNEVTLYPDWLTDIDGIEFEADGTLQVTLVGGPLVRIPMQGEPQVLGGDGVSSANHGYDPKSGLALIPTGFDNTIIAIRVISNE